MSALLEAAAKTFEAYRREFQRGLLRLMYLDGKSVMTADEQAEYERLRARYIGDAP